MFTFNRYFRGNDLVLGTGIGAEQIILTEAQRRQHTYIPGLTRTGKSRLLHSMIWQDIIQWHRLRKGLLLLGTDGEVYEGLMKRIARHPELWRLPIIPIDLTRHDQIIGYNLMRRRGDDDDPAVIALNFLEAIRVAFCDLDVMAKPTLYRTAVTVLRALYEANMSIAHAPMVLDPAQTELRARLATFITDPIALANLARINDKTGRAFDDETLAFANRMFGPLSNRLLRHMFGQTDASFDFDRVLEDGAIVLVSLATQGNAITDTDARLVGSLLLADLWQAAKRRGKKGAGLVKGFNVFIDEFHWMMSPTIAANLSRASGYGLYFHLANQLVTQLLDYGGAYGPAIYHAVMGNTRNKIVFRASTEEEDLRPMTRALFHDQVDINLVKDVIDGYQVVGHKEVHRLLKGFGTSTTDQMAWAEVAPFVRTENALG